MDLIHGQRVLADNYLVMAISHVLIQTGEVGNQKTDSLCGSADLSLKQFLANKLSQLAVDLNLSKHGATSSLCIVGAIHRKDRGY